MPFAQALSWGASPAQRIVHTRTPLATRRIVMKTYWICLLTLCAISTNTCGAQSLVAPPGYATLDGDSYLSPFSTAVPFRFQQVYSSSIFSDYQGGIEIRQMAFRGDGSGGNTWLGSVSNIEVHLSTTTKAVDGLSTNFSANVGTDDHLILNREQHITFSIIGDDSGRAQSWGAIFSFQTNRFTYYPSEGNLLLEIDIFAGMNMARLDAVGHYGDSVSSVYGYVGSPGWPISDTRGLATYFSFDPIPEPGMATMFSVSLIMLGSLYLLKRKSKK